MLYNSDYRPQTPTLQNSGDDDGETARALGEPRSRAEGRVQDEAARADVANVALAVAQALARRPQCTVQLFPVRRVSDVLRALRSFVPDVVFNLCESLLSDARYEPVVAAVQERLGAVFTGNGPRVLRLCLDKYACNQALQRAGLMVPRSALVDSGRDLPSQVVFPAIVKPNREDGSTGIHSGSVVQDRDQSLAQIEHLRHTVGGPIIVQEYIDGRELNVAVLGNQPVQMLPLAEIDFGSMPTGLPHIVSYAAKWDLDSPECSGTRVVAAALEPDVERRVRRLVRGVADALDLQGYARVDLRLDHLGRPFVVDVNPNCDIGPTGGMALAAARADLPYPELIWTVVQLALQRQDLSSLAVGRGRTARGSCAVDRAHP